MNSFAQRKKSVLEKKDKATKGSWDERVVGLCEKLNSMDNYYTTSSCSGKSVLMKDKVGKNGTYYLWSSHDLLGVDELKEAIGNVDVLRGIVKFKSESPIVFVVCRDIDSAKLLLDEAISAGFKESGIKITNKLIAVEIRSGEKIELPIISNGELLVWDEYLRVLAEEVNGRRMIGWKKVNLLIEGLNFNFE